MIRIFTGCAVLLGLTAFAAATPQIDCTVQDLRGTDRGLLSMNDLVFEIVLDEQVALDEGLWTPEAFCAIQDDDFVAFILPVPRLPEDMPVSPAMGIGGEMLEPWTAKDPKPSAGSIARAPTVTDTPDTTTTVVERHHGLVWGPTGVDEPAPSPSRDSAEHRVAADGCSATPGESSAWWGLLALLAVARRRDAR
ncbi:MAG: MYXO-CTERM domain-containing protein [Bradymonadia bacterium]|jgi:MYXO-CTERM domain-containing protein